MQSVFIHPFAGVLSAFGMGLADVRAVAEATVEGASDWGPIAAELGEQARESLKAQGAGAILAEVYGR